MTLYHADCLHPVEGLARLGDGSVDHVITDPPYEAEAHTKQRRTKVAGWRKARDRGEADKVATAAPLEFSAITGEQRRNVAAQIGRVCRGWAVVFCQVEAVHAWRNALGDAGMRYRRTIVWVKPDAMPSLHGRWPGQGFEAIVLAQASRKGAPKCPGGGKAIYFEHRRAQTGVHPTAKPLPLMRDLVELVSNPGELVCDPYAGSGTTGVACRALGRKFVGWEVDAEHFRTALRRIAGDDAKPEGRQRELFGRVA
jgi:site-specific DNA-methyltransferase (adenine-specific)